MEGVQAVRVPWSRLRGPRPFLPWGRLSRTRLHPWGRRTCASWCPGLVPGVGVWGWCPGLVPWVGVPSAGGARQPPRAAGVRREPQGGCLQSPVFHRAGLWAALLGGPGMALAARSPAPPEREALPSSLRLGTGAESHQNGGEPSSPRPRLPTAPGGELLCRCKNQLGKSLFMLDTAFAKLFYF